MLLFVWVVVDAGGMASRFFSTLRRAQAVQVYVFDVSKGIAKCTSFSELEALLFTLDRRSIAQPAVLATAIGRLGELRSVERSVTDQHVQKSAVIKTLLELCGETRFPSLPAAVFKGLAGGRLVQEMPPKLIEQFARELPQLRPTTMVSCLLSVAQLGEQANVSELLTKVELELLSPSQTREFTPSQLVQLVWSFGRLNAAGARPVMEHLMHRLVGEQTDWCSALSVQELVHLVWALNGANLRAQFPAIIRELIGKRGGWRAVVSTNALADLTVSVVDSLGDKDLGSLRREWVHNRKLGEVDTARLLKLVLCLAQHAPASLSVFPLAAQEFTDRHFIGMRFEDMSALVCEYSRIGQMDHVGLFDKAGKEMIKPKHWKPCLDAALPVALARLPQAVRDQPNLSLLIDKLSFDQIKPEQQLLAAWAFACLGKPVPAAFPVTGGGDRVTLRMLQELAWCVGKEQHPELWHMAFSPQGAEDGTVINPALLARLRSEFTTVEHQVPDGFWVDAYVANRGGGGVVVETGAGNFASDGSTLLGPAEFRQRMLERRGHRVLFLRPTTTKSKLHAHVDELVLAIATGE